MKVIPAAVKELKFEDNLTRLILHKKYLFLVKDQKILASIRNNGIETVLECKKMRDMFNRGYCNFNASYQKKTFLTLA